MRSGRMKSSTAAPSLRNSGLETTRSRRPRRVVQLLGNRRTHPPQGRFDVDLSLSAIEASFGRALVRVHRNWLVNLAHVRELERDGGATSVFVGSGVGPESFGVRAPVLRDHAQEEPHAARSRRCAAEARPSADARRAAHGSVTSVRGRGSSVGGCALSRTPLGHVGARPRLVRRRMHAEPRTALSRPCAAESRPSADAR